MARKPMEFGLDTETATPQSKTSTVRVASAPDGARKAVATRLPPDLYRQAKARAALDDMSIQSVIEAALRQYVAKGVQ